MRKLSKRYTLFTKSFIALLIVGLAGEPLVASWGKKFSSGVRKVGRNLDPTNPNGAVRNGAQSLANGIKDPLKVTRHVGSVLAEVGAEVGEIGTDPIGALNQAISQFKKEVSKLEERVDFLNDLKVNLPDVKSPAFLNKQLKSVSLANFSLPSVPQGQSLNIMAGVLSLKKGMEQAGNGIHRFIMKDIPRESKRFGGDISREAKVAGGHISREWKNCISGGCDVFAIIGFSLGTDNCDEMADSDKLPCLRRERQDLESRKRTLQNKINAQVSNAKYQVRTVKRKRFLKEIKGIYGNEDYQKRLEEKYPNGLPK